MPYYSVFRVADSDSHLAQVFILGYPGQLWLCLAIPSDVIMSSSSIGCRITIFSIARCNMEDMSLLRETCLWSCTSQPLAQSRLRVPHNKSHITPVSHQHNHIPERRGRFYKTGEYWRRRAAPVPAVLRPQTPLLPAARSTCLHEYSRQAYVHRNALLGTMARPLCAAAKFSCIYIPIEDKKTQMIVYRIWDLHKQE